MSGRVWAAIFIVASLVVADVEAKKPSSKESSFDWAPVTEADWQAGAGGVDGGKGAVMLLERISVDERGFEKEKVSLVLYRRIRILSEAGRSWADVEAPMEYEGEDMPQVGGRTILPGGETIALNREDVHFSTVVKAGDEEVRQTRFSLPGVTGDCIIEYYLKYPEINSRDWIVQKDILLVRGEYQWYYFNFKKSWTRWISGMPFVYSFLREPEHVWRNLPPRAPRTFPQTKDSTELLFVVDSVPPFQSEPVSFPDRALKGRLNCQNGSGSLDIELWSTLTTGLANWVKEDFGGKVVKVKEVVSQLAGGSAEEKLRSAYEWVQANITNTSYVDLNKAVERKGPAARRPVKEKYNETADDVVKRGYGWHADLSALFCVMARELGFDARMALVVDRDKDIFERRVKDWQFDRELVAVYDSTGKARFFSPGVPFMPYGAVPWFNEGVTALIEGTQGTMITVPMTGPEATEEIQMYTLAVSPGEKTTGSAQVRLGGHSAASVRREILYADSSEYQESLKEAVEPYLPDGQLDSLVCTGASEINRPLEINCRLEFAPVEAAGDKVLLNPFDCFVKRFNPFVSAERRTPIAFGYAYRRREAAQIAVPDGWAVEALPADTLFSNRIGECGVQFVQFGNTLSVQRVFKLNGPLWKVEDYRDVRSLFQAREDMSEKIVVLKKAGGE